MDRFIPIIHWTGAGRAHGDRDTSYHLWGKPTLGKSWIKCMGLILIEYNTELNFLLISLFVVLRLSIWCIEICLVMMTTLEICRYKDISKCVCFGSIRSIFSRERLDGFIDPFNGASSLQPHSVLEIVRSAKKYVTIYYKIIKNQFCIWFLSGMILGF